MARVQHEVVREGKLSPDCHEACQMRDTVSKRLRRAGLVTLVCSDADAELLIYLK
jgi:hypothetical protein